MLDIILNMICTDNMCILIVIIIFAIVISKLHLNINEKEND